MFGQKISFCSKIRLANTMFRGKTVKFYRVRKLYVFEDLSYRDFGFFLVKKIVPGLFFFLACATISLLVLISE